MELKTDPFENEETPETSETTKKQWGLNALTLAGVFLLGIILPPKYKALSPLLFVIPFIINIVGKIRGAEENPVNPSHPPASYPHMPDPRLQPPEPYSYKPKNPKDPRKYKPIG